MPGSDPEQQGGHALFRHSASWTMTTRCLWPRIETYPPNCGVDTVRGIVRKKKRNEKRKQKTLNVAWHKQCNRFHHMTLGCFLFFLIFFFGFLWIKLIKKSSSGFQFFLFSFVVYFYFFIFIFIFLTLNDCQL